MADRRDELIQYTADNEIDYWNLPQYGMIADFTARFKILREMAADHFRTDLYTEPEYELMKTDDFLRYWHLHNIVLERLNEEPYHEPLHNRVLYELERQGIDV